MTGAEFYLQLQQKYDKAYSQYLDTSKANRLIKEALYRLVDKLVSLMDTQKEYDEMSEMLKYDISLAVGGGVANQPNDYYHLMRMAFVFVDPITFTSISTTNVVSSDPFVRVGDIISTAADGTGTLRTVTKTTSTGFTVDSTFLPGVTNLYVVRNFEGSPSTSDKKKPSLSKPVKESPRYWTGVAGTDKVFFLQPVPTKVIVDYITQPPLNIDVVNNSTVLTTVYTQKFLYRLMDECVYSVATETRDYQNKQSATQTIIDNP